MSLNAYAASAGVFIRGLTNLKGLLTKAEAHAASSGSAEAALLDARLTEESGVPSHPSDVHMFTLVAQVHWAAQGAQLAVERLLGAPSTPAASDAKSFAELHQRLDATIAYLRAIPPSELEAGLERTIVMDNRRGSLSLGGSQFLLAYAIPHFLYHVTTAYGILRNHGVPLTMGDFLGDFSRAS